MSLFNDPIYDYWQVHIDFLWQIKSVAIGDGLLAILDQRARKLLAILKQLSENPSVQIKMDDFTHVPADYYDLQVVAYLLSSYLSQNVQVINRNIIYTP